MTPTHTLLYYTSNLVPDAFAQRVRNTLSVSSGNRLPIVSVSQHPIPFGYNVCVGELGASIHTCYFQILAGAYHVTTPYVICCEDDALYAPEHIAFTPPQTDTFYYNHNRYTVDPSGMYFRRPNRNMMGMCVCSTALLRDTLHARLMKYPCQNHSMVKYFAEPGKYEAAIGLPTVRMQPFHTPTASLTFNHRPSMGGVRKSQPTDDITPDLPYWGDARGLWDLYAPHENPPACTRTRNDGGYITRLAGAQ